MTASYENPHPKFGTQNVVHRIVKVWKESRNQICVSHNESYAQAQWLDKDQVEYVPALSKRGHSGYVRLTMPFYIARGRGFLHA